jgi:hypothetical protein
MISLIAGADVPDGAIQVPAAHALNAQLKSQLGVISPQRAYQASRSVAGHHSRMASSPKRATSRLDLQIRIQVRRWAASAA